MLDQQAASVFGRRVAAVPAARGLAGCLSNQVYRGCGLPSFLRLREPRVVCPTVAVTADVPAGSGNRRCGRRVYFERSGTPKDRYRQLETGEDAMQAPEPDPRAIFEHTLRGEIATLHAEIGAEHLGEPALGDAIPSG